jgi:hypothetical protein
MFFGAQRPRLLTRVICLYIDPYTVPVDPDFRFPEADLATSAAVRRCRAVRAVRCLTPSAGKKSIVGIRPSIRSGADTSSVETLSTGLRPVDRSMR